MNVLKFGGTSVGTANSIKKVATIVNTSKVSKIVVLSAVAGTTNALINSVNFAVKHNFKQAKNEIDVLELAYHELINELYKHEFYKLKALTFVQKKFNKIYTYSKDITINANIMVAQGELISTQLFQYYLEELGMQSKLISALDFMIINRFGEPEFDMIESKLKSVIQKDKSCTIYITQGYICRDSNGKIDNLKRGGSDYSASLIGAAVGANEIQIWTDISGMHNNDPRYVENTFTVDEMSFDEAAELAYFGAKILHPQSIIPAQKSAIPVVLKNTFKPNEKGTVINNCKPSIGIRAIAAKDEIIAIKIKSYRMLLAYGFLKKIFEVFEKYQTAIDMITTSEIAVSLTIDDGRNLKQIIKELEYIGKVEVDTQMSIVCLVGDFSQSEKGISASVLSCLVAIPIRMISYGGSNYNMSLLVSTDDKVNALNLLNEGLFVDVLEARLIN